jgi:ABC-type transport system involved in cytochrome c biogenesis permease subunit
MLIGLAYALLWAATLAYLVYVRSAKRLAGWAATGTTWIAWGLLVAGLFERGLTAGHWPLTNRYEFALCCTCTVITIYLLSEASWHERRAGVFVLAIALLAMTYAVTRPAAEQAIAPLLPALRSVWLQVHVLTALIGYGAFSVAAGWGMAQLLPIPSPVTTGEGQGGGDSERAMVRVLALGFPWLTLSILTGAIWAQNAWGRYWGWDPKETWALVTWLWYLLILHVRSLRGWRGRRLAGLVVAGLGVVIFSFIGVPWLVRTVRLESLHGF